MGDWGVKDVCRGLLWSDCGVAGGFVCGLRGARGMNGRRGGMELNEDVSLREVSIYSEERNLIFTEW